jgi:hypothetical protein
VSIAYFQFLFRKTKADSEIQDPWSQKNQTTDLFLPAYQPPHCLQYCNVLVPNERDLVMKTSTGFKSLEEIAYEDRSNNAGLLSRAYTNCHFMHVLASTIIKTDKNFPPKAIIKKQSYLVVAIFRHHLKNFCMTKSCSSNHNNSIYNSPVLLLPQYKY